MTYLHGDNIQTNWSKLSLEAQLGNIGGEFERALRWKAKGQTQMFENASARMLELFYLTVADTRWHGPELTEICRAREVAVGELYDGNEIKRDPESLKKYFLQFAIAARINT